MGTDRIGRITTDGQVIEFPLPTTGVMASMITTGPDRALWFTLNQTHAIGRLSIDGEITIHPLPTPAAGPVGVTATPDAVWFVEIGTSQVGRISPDGRIHEFAGLRTGAPTITPPLESICRLLGKHSLYQRDERGGANE